MVLLRRISLLTIMSVLASACFTSYRASAPPVKPPNSNDIVQVRYLGVGGFFIRLGDDVIMTAPLYSNPGLLKVIGGEVYPDPVLIERLHFRELNRNTDVRDVKAILVGHAHYDHLMDVPFVWGFSAKTGVSPLILGSSTMKRVLAPYSTIEPKVDSRYVVALNDTMDDYVDSRNCAGEDPSPHAKTNRCKPFPGLRGRPYPIPRSRIEVRAFCARHPPQFLTFHQGPGCLKNDLTVPPRRADTDYLEGETLAYLIDFLDPQNRIRFRIYYQDVPSDGRFGKVPEDVLAEHPVDLALLCAGNWAKAQHHDSDCIVCNLKPEHVLIGHWEDFFEPQQQGRHARSAPLQQIGEFRRLVKLRMAEAGRNPDNVLVPEPQVLQTYPVRANSFGR